MPRSRSQSDRRSWYCNRCNPLKATQGISAQDLDKAIAGSRLLVVGPGDNEEACEHSGSPEALLEFLSQVKYPFLMLVLDQCRERCYESWLACLRSE